MVAAPALDLAHALRLAEPQQLLPPVICGVVAALEIEGGLFRQHHAGAILAANPAIHSPGHDVEAGGQELHCVADEGEANDAPARGVRVEEVVGEV